MSEIDATLTDFLHDAMPFAGVLGIEVVSADSEAVIAEVSWAADRCTSGGILHGGYLMAVADTLGGALATYNLPLGAGTATIESKTNFLRAAPAGTYTATTTAVHVGRTTIVAQTDITRADGKLVTRTTQTQAVIPAG